MVCRVEYVIEKGKVVGLKIWFEPDSTLSVDFESMGLVGEFDPKTRRIKPFYVLISSENRVRAWLNKFGGADIIEYVRYDKYAKLLNKVKELEKRVEELAGKE